MSPTQAPTVIVEPPTDTESPTESTLFPTTLPTFSPSTAPTIASPLPTEPQVTLDPTQGPSPFPTQSPSEDPTKILTASPSSTQTLQPVPPSPFPSTVPTRTPVEDITPEPSHPPSNQPTFDVSPEPTTPSNPVPTEPLECAVCPDIPSTTPLNDDCAQAQSLTIGGLPVIGNSNLATNQARNNDVIYSFVGNGRRVRISTCFQETTTAHNLVLRNGGCGSQLFGETRNDPSCVGNFNAATYDFDTVLNRQYPLIVYPRNPGQFGQFSIQVADYVNPSNDNCDQATSLLIGGPPTIGSTVNATSSSRDNDVVYLFVGNGRRVRISSCFDDTTTPHNIVLRNGGCGSQLFGDLSSDPFCPGNSNAASYEFDSFLGRQYPIFVYPRNPGAEGQFAIQVTDFVNPENDNCDQAILLTIGGSPTVGSTINATASSRIDDVAYTFVGNGRRVLVSTCSPETTTPHNIVIRNGGCGSQLFGERKIDPSCAGNTNAAAFEFDSINGRQYPIFVYPRNQGQPGQFAIQVLDFVNPVNDDCDQAISLEIGGPVVVGSTVNATQSTREEDVVYSFVGNGQRVRISTCSSDTTTAHDIVLRNGGCGSGLFGPSGVDFLCTGNAKAAAHEFDSIVNRLYPIFVSPRRSDQAGQFAIQVTEVPSSRLRTLQASSIIDDDMSSLNQLGRQQPLKFIVQHKYEEEGLGPKSLFLDADTTASLFPGPVTNDHLTLSRLLLANTPSLPCLCPESTNPSYNDDCDQYQSLEIGFTPLIGSTSNATDEIVHYGFVGNGRRVRISTCFDETTTAHNLVLRNGGCGSQFFGDASTDPSCVGNANAAAYEFDTVENRFYPIVMYPRNTGQTGQFAIQVTDFVNPSNDYCDQSISLQFGGSPVIGSTVNATASTRISDVAYSFVGNGRRVRISTCFDETLTPHDIVLRNGGCGSQLFGERSADLSCGQNSDAAAYEFDSIIGRTYPILVFPRNVGQQGQFAIQVTDFVNPVNDACDQAISLEINGMPTVGSTVNATLTTRSEDVVYRFIGNGRRMRISTCFDETTTAHNIVLRNGGCGSQLFGETITDPTCLGNPNAATFEFDTVAGREYPVFVYPRNPMQPGSFALQVTDFVNPSNDICEQAISLEIDAALPTLGSTVNATTQTRNDDVVYFIVGNGEPLRITTCFQETTVPHSLVFRNGGCGSQLFGQTTTDDQCSSSDSAIVDPGFAAAFEFESILGRLYPIIVYPRMEDQNGPFAIQVVTVPTAAPP